MMPAQHHAPGDQQQGVDHRAGQVPGALAAVQRQLPCEGWHKRRAHGAFGKQVADEVGDAAGDAERVVGVAGAEVERQHLIANQAEDPACDGGQPEDPGRAGQAWLSAFAPWSFGGTFGVGHQSAQA